MKYGFRLALLLLALITASRGSAMLENVLLYFPSHSPDEHGLTRWEHEGDTIGYTRPHLQPRAIWLVMHGNAGQAAQRGYMFQVLPSTDAVFILEYPGYGRRPGRPSMKSINAAAEEAYHVLRKQYGSLPLGVVGESLGSGPASHLCSLSAPPDRAVLIVPFNTLLELAREHVRYLPVSLLLRDRWDNGKALAHYRGRIDIFAAIHDEIIPVHHARSLAQALASAKYHEIPSTHNDWTAYVKVDSEAAHHE